MRGALLQFLLPARPTTLVCFVSLAGTWNLLSSVSLLIPCYSIHKRAAQFSKPSGNHESHTEKTVRLAASTFPPPLIPICILGCAHFFVFYHLTTQY